ncbi:hypothetical protein HELRODRAFT_168105 [Helobdella robusta]|uniref:Uncharacterized protein n=1 Tax=Helobdella robusta TaxID=6412 RepID=T1F062_HELRO|nr:hypothetical protein HELRODRAFT_168105 [Helobdella robusta]ESO10221.1 hypothetical protein HELRODRAFT_168105 [Helobdella robusta]
MASRAIAQVTYLHATPLMLLSHLAAGRKKFWQAVRKLIDVLEGNMSMSSSMNFSDVPIMDSLKKIIDKDESISISDVSEYTPMMDIQYSSRKNRLNHFIRVQLEPLSNKTFNFYSRYKNSKENISTQFQEINIAPKPLLVKSIEESFSENKNTVEDKYPYVVNLFQTTTKSSSAINNQNVVIQVHEEDESKPLKISKTEKSNNKELKASPVQLKKLRHSFSYPSSSMKYHSAIINKPFKSLPNCNLSYIRPYSNAKRGGLTPAFRTPQAIISTDNRGNDQQARRNSFRKKLHNLKKYADESIVIECSNNLSLVPQQLNLNQRDDFKTVYSVASVVPEQSSSINVDNNIKLKNFSVKSAETPEIIRTTISTTSTTSTTVGNITNLTSTASQELSKELWQLRALLANNVDDLDSEESIPATPFNLENVNNTSSLITMTNTEDSPFHSFITSSCNSSLLESFHSIEDTLDFENLQNLSANIDKNELALKLLSKGINDSNTLKFCKELIAKFASSTLSQPTETSTKDNCEEVLDISHKDSKKETVQNQKISQSEQEELNLVRKPSVRRQTYRNAIARRQAKEERLQQKSEIKMEPKNEKNELNANTTQKLNLTTGSETSQDTESSISFERFLATGGSCSTTAASLSCDDSNASTDSTGESHLYKLEKLRGDSGYKSLENQQSLNMRYDYRSTLNFVPQESNIISEDELMMSPIVTGASSSIPVLTRRVHSADENLVRTNSIIPNVELIAPSVPQSSVAVNKSSTNLSLFTKMSQQVLLSRNKAAEKKRIQYKCDRQLIKIQDSFIDAGFKNVKVTTTSSQCVAPKPPFYSSGSINLSNSSFASSFISRFLKSHSRRSLVRMQRDYSIDERTDALFNEFLRFDPALEIKHTLCVTRRPSPRTRHHAHYTNRHKSTEHRSSTSPSKLTSFLATNDSPAEMKIKRHDRRQYKFSTTDKIADINLSSKYVETQSYKRFQNFNTFDKDNSQKLNELEPIVSNIKTDQDNDVNKEGMKSLISPKTLPKVSTNTTNHPTNNATDVVNRMDRSTGQIDAKRNIPVIQLTEEE